MKKWTKAQKQTMVDFLNNLSIVIITLGLIQPIFEKVRFTPIIFLQFIISFILSIIILIINFLLLGND